MLQVSLFDLKGGVSDIEMLFQLFLKSGYESVTNAIGHHQMGCQSYLRCAHGPYVKVVQVHHAGL